MIPAKDGIDLHRFRIAFQAANSAGVIAKILRLPAEEN